MSDRITITSYRREYFVEFIDSCLETFREHVAAKDFVVIDHNICDLYPELARLATSCPHRIIAPSEKAKSYEALMPLIEQLIEGRFTKSNQLVAIGGGVIQDITAFTASILYRGVDWTFFPTNLLTQCDSCIGSKTSINFGAYKNQLGGFFPPRAVFIDLNLLESLPGQDVRSGLGEMLHYFLVTSAADLELFWENAESAKTGGRGVETLVRRSLEIKKAMVEIDEFDRGPRNVFNYGHSFGHALESATGYAVPHGIAVAYGIDLANVVAVSLDIMTREERNRIRPACELVFDGSPLPALDMGTYCDALHRDKKNLDNRLGLILGSRIGAMRKHLVGFDEKLQKLITRFFSEQLYLQDL